MEHLIEVVFRRHRLTLVDLPTDSDHRDERAVVLDVYVDGRYRCRLRGLVSRTNLLGWRQTHVAESRFVAFVARYAAEALQSRVLVDPEALSPGVTHTVVCGPYRHWAYESLVPPGPGAVLFTFRFRADALAAPAP